MVLFMITIWHYFVKKDYLKLAFTFVSFAGFFVFLMVLFSRGNSDLVMEKNLIPLWFFVAIPFIHDVLFQKFRRSHMMPIIYAIIIIIGLAGFYRATVLYGERARYMKQIIATACLTTHSNKVVIEKKNLQMNKLLGTWTFATETLLMSAIEDPSSSKTVYLVDNMEQLKDYDMQKTDVYLCMPFWLEWHYSSLNQRYFQLPREPYRIVESLITFE